MTVSYYKVIKGKKCRRDLIELCKENIIIEDVARKLWKAISCKGSPKRLSQATKNSLRYLRQNHVWDPNAAYYLRTKIRSKAATP